MTSWRVFCAVELPENVKTQLQEHASTLRKAYPDVAASWTRIENVHLTLKFFGNVDIDRIPAISAAIARTVEGFAPIKISVGQTGVFPKRSRPQVLWIGVSDPSSELSKLQQHLEDECSSEGFAKEDRAYKPHLTIARIRNPHGARALADTHLQTEFELIDLTLSDLILFRSELSPKGSRYTVISHRPLPNP